jgi:hypothetical protein
MEKSQSFFYRNYYKDKMMDVRKEVLSKTYIAEEIARYECAIVNQARRIATGESKHRPDKEHLRVLLSWLDGSEKENSNV